MKIIKHIEQTVKVEITKKFAQFGSSQKSATNSKNALERKCESFVLHLRA